MLPASRPPARTAIRRTAATLAAAVAAVVCFAGPAAAATAEEKLTVLSGWTQTSAGSYDAWNTARTHQSDWTAYGFTWSTDYCSASPDQPLGFDFRLPCWRHDFGYRNYKAVEQFPANKARLDSAFYADLKRKCATYSALSQPSCDSLAWTYYQAVKAFGSVVVRQQDLDRAALALPAV